MTIHVVIVEDNPLVVDLLKAYFDNDDIRIVAHYASGEEALNKIPVLPLPDVLLMDVSLPNLSGIEVTYRLKERFPNLKILIMTVDESTEVIVGAIKAGADGYVLKASSKEDFIRALEDVKRGESFLSGKIAKKVLAAFPKALKNNINISEFGLTTREAEILNKLMEGLSVKELAEEVGISINTINVHIQKIYEKLKVNSRAEAMAKITRITNS